MTPFGSRVVDWAKNGSTKRCKCPGSTANRKWRGKRLRCKPCTVAFPKEKGPCQHHRCSHRCRDEEALKSLLWCPVECWHCCQGSECQRFTQVLNDHIRYHNRKRGKEVKEKLQKNWWWQMDEGWGYYFLFLCFSFVLQRSSSRRRPRCCWQRRMDLRQHPWVLLQISPYRRRYQCGGLIMIT